MRVIEESYCLSKSKNAPFLSDALKIPRGLDRFMHTAGHEQSRFMALGLSVYILLCKVSDHPALPEIVLA